MSLSLLRDLVRSVGGGEAILTVHAVLCALEPRYMLHNSLEKHVQSWSVSRGISVNRILEVEDSIHWRLYGLNHRFMDKPAVVFPGGVKHWLYHGKIHREGELPAIVLPNRHIRWQKDDKVLQMLNAIQDENGKAVEWVCYFFDATVAPLTEYDGIPVRVPKKY